jgi:hypothetical protein
MKTYSVGYRQTDPIQRGNEIESCVVFQADDVSHAIEQAEDHLKSDYMVFEILSVVCLSR